MRSPTDGLLQTVGAERNNLLVTLTTAARYETRSSIVHVKLTIVYIANSLKCFTEAESLRETLQPTSMKEPVRERSWFYRFDLVQHRNISSL